MTTRVLSVTEGKSIRYNLSGSNLLDVQERIAAIRTAARDAGGTCAFHSPHRGPDGLYRAVGWVDGQ